jgi:hypothetical protein
MWGVFLKASAFLWFAAAEAELCVEKCQIICHFCGCYLGFHAQFIKEQRMYVASTAEIGRT